MYACMRYAANSCLMHNAVYSGPAIPTFWQGQELRYLRYFQVFQVLSPKFLMLGQMWCVALIVTIHTHVCDSWTRPMLLSHGAIVFAPTMFHLLCTTLKQELTHNGAGLPKHLQGNMSGYRGATQNVQGRSCGYEQLVTEDHCR